MHIFLFITNTIAFLPQIDPHIERLIKACKKGKQSAQLELYDRYSKAMYNTAYRIVQDRFEAEDIMQDSFLTAFTKIESLKEAALFGAWLKKIVIHNSLSHYKTKMKQKEVPLEQVLFKVEGVEEEAKDENYTQLKAQQVLETLNELKNNYRLALTLHLVEGYDYEEISGIMEITNANCRTLISRAKASLRKKLQPLVA